MIHNTRGERIERLFGLGGCARIRCSLGGSRLRSSGLGRGGFRRGGFRRGGFRRSRLLGSGLGLGGRLRCCLCLGCRGSTSDILGEESVQLKEGHRGKRLTFFAAPRLDVVVVFFAAGALAVLFAGAFVGVDLDAVFVAGLVAVALAGVLAFDVVARAVDLVAALEVDFDFATFALLRAVVARTVGSGLRDEAAVVFLVVVAFFTGACTGLF
jgi:hypothetical protein